MNRVKLLGLIFIFLYSCGTNQEYKLEVPDGFPEINPVEKNPLSQAGVDLGRRLFYDPILSSNGKVSCASCHLQTMAFTDGQQVARNGVSGAPGQRNTPTLANLAWQKYFFWDGGARNLESQSFAPLMHADEMNVDLRRLTVRLSKHSIYPKLFSKVFHKDSITSAQVVRALAQFQRTIISSQSRYDRFEEGKVKFSEIENRGLRLFQQRCSTCHTPPLFMDNEFHNNGLDSIYSEEKEGILQGRYRITLKKEDMGKFKTPTLRNIIHTSPYMHDGRFKTLDEVLNHYRSGIKPSVSLDASLRMAPTLTHKEIKALKSFLETLSDPEYMTNSHYATPF